MTDSFLPYFWLFFSLAAFVAFLFVAFRSYQNFKQKAYVQNLIHTHASDEEKSQVDPQNKTPVVEKKSKIIALKNRINRYLEPYGMGIDQVIIYLLILYPTLSFLIYTYVFKQFLGYVVISPSITFILIRLLMSVKKGSRIASIKKDFPLVLNMLSRRLKSGGNVTESISYVSNEVPNEVWAKEFKLVYLEIEAGNSLVRILEKSKKRISIQEYDLFCSILIMQNKMGGRLASMIENIAEMIRTKESMHKKIRAMSSQSKASAYFIAAFPFLGISLIFYNNPNALLEMIDKPVGVKILLIGGGLYLTGLFILKKATTIKS